VRAVVDSPVLISAFLRSGPPREVFIAAREHRFTLCLSAILLEEIRRGLLKERNRARYGCAAEQVEAFVAALADGAIIVRRFPRISRFAGTE
jgi:predicted nucleic acid-binding protein